LSLASVTQGTNGGVVGISGQSVIYSNNVVGADSFNYVVIDSRGSYATNTVFVNVTNVTNMTNQQSPEISFNGGNINLTNITAIITSSQLDTSNKNNGASYRGSFAIMTSLFIL
jgi:hypothetical protein